MVLRIKDCQSDWGNKTGCAAGSAESSLPSMMYGYLYTGSMPDASDSERTEMAYVLNETLHRIS